MCIRDSHKQEEKQWRWGPTGTDKPRSGARATCGELDRGQGQRPNKVSEEIRRKSTHVVGCELGLLEAASHRLELLPRAGHADLQPEGRPGEQESADRGQGEQDFGRAALQEASAVAC